MAKEIETAITPTREQDYPEWYQQVVKAAELAENSIVRGCMVIRPWGWGVWENIQRDLDRRIKETGHENAYFPLFIPVSLLEKEAAHVEGFAKECAVVTHHRLEAKDGKLVPAGELEEPLIVRPTSETIIGESFSKWVQSYRDLPLLINQWANVVRWEMRTRLFLRTAEFLWQEGHTVHADEADAKKEVRLMLDTYQAFVEEVMALPVIPGEKTEGERFPGAVNTFTIEAMMQDRKALQAGTSHYLGNNFAKASEIKFLDQDGVLKYAHTTSWGVSTRLIGALIMAHADDDGMRMPPRVSPKQIVILPVIPKPELEAKVLAYAEEVAASLKALTYHGYPLQVTVDKRDIRGGEKNWQWIKRGIPVRIEVGPRDMDSGSVMLSRRDKAHKEKTSLAKGELPGKILGILDEIQSNYFNQAKAFRDANIRTDIETWDEFQKFFREMDNEQGIRGGFVKAKFCGDPKAEEMLKELKVTVRCMPLEQSGTAGKCILTGKPATIDALFARAY